MKPGQFADLTEAQRDAAQAALRHVLGSTPIEAIAPVSGGTTAAAVFRIDAAGKSWVLRVEGQPSPLRNPINMRRCGSRLTRA